METKRKDAEARRGRGGQPLAGKPSAWMQQAVKRPGALTRRARAAGLTPMQFAREHAHDPGLRGEQARFALIAQGKPIPGDRKPRRHAPLPRVAAG